MIVTLTANPSLDRTLHLTELVHRGVNRAVSVDREPSGKGVNVSLALHVVGTPTWAVLPVGGPSGVELSDLLAATGVPSTIVPIEDPVRSNLSLVEADGSTTKVNESGPRLTEAEVEALIAAAESAAPPGSWLAYCGSLTEGFTVDRLRRALVSGRAGGRSLALDTSESTLMEMLAGPAESLPDLVKPNTHELATVVRHPLHTLGDVMEAAETVRARGVRTVLVSLGGDGALLLDEQGALHGVAPVDRVVNTAGAGDSFLAGYLHGRHLDDRAREAALATALTWGAIAVQHSGTVFPGLGSGAVPSVRIDGADPTRSLREPAR